jgi:hypothetical protein
LNIDLPEDVDNQEAYIKKVDHYLFQEAWPDPYGKMIIAVPTSHKPALRWVEQAMPHFNDVCVSAAVRAWNSRSLRNAIMLVPLFEQYLAMKQNLIAESEFTVALWRFLIITNRAGCKAVSENEELEHTPIAQVYRLAAHLKDHIDIRSPDLVSARQLIAYYLPSIDRRQFYQAAELTMQKFKLLQSDIINRYPLIADMLAHVNKQFEGQNRSSYSYYNWRYELPTLPTQVLLNYIKFIEDLNNERHHPQKRFSLVDCRLVNSGDRWPRLSGTSRPPELAGDPEGDHRRGLRQSN